MIAKVILRRAICLNGCYGVRRTASCPSSKTPSFLYQERVAAGHLTNDICQRPILDELDKLHDKLRNYTPPRTTAWWLSWIQTFEPSSLTARVPQSLYIYGGVGCGKTMLMDLFYESCDCVTKKMRVHFNSFMIDVHKAIHTAKFASSSSKSRSKSPVLDPISRVSRDIVSKTWLLCFDEFQVTDVADAMILKRLFTELFAQGVIVVATSNRKPDDLYKNGLQRVNFVPFISILKSHCTVLPLDSLIDYRRLTIMSEGKAFFCSRDSGFIDKIHAVFTALVEQERRPIEPLHLVVFGRELVFPRACGGVVCASFDELCEECLGAADYVSLAQACHTLVLHHVPQLSLQRRSSTRRFIILVDTLYDEGVRVVLGAELPPDQLFVRGELNSVQRDAQRQLIDDLGLTNADASSASLFSGEEELFAYERTVSRLSEMLSEQYWDAHHHNCPHSPEHKRSLG